MRDGALAQFVLEKSGLRIEAQIVVTRMECAWLGIISRGLSEGAGWTPWQYVVRYHEGQDLVQLLFEYGADATAEDKDGRTLLQLVIEMGREDFARLLLEHGADATTKDKDRSTPLHLAVQTGRDDRMTLCACSSSMAQMRMPRISTGRLRYICLSRREDDS
jgi:hypothetical protein